MCLKTAIKATSLCSIPSLVGFAGGVLSVESPRLFAWILLTVLVVGAYAMIRGAARAGNGNRAYDVEEVTVVAGALLALGFIFSLWTGIAFSAGFGILPAGVIVCVSMTLLSAFTLTFVRRVIARDVKWVNQIVQTLFPDAGANNDGDVATRH